MRPDQMKMLNDLAEKLADVFLVEADPDNWSGGGLPADMSKEDRGNRHWDRKGAMGTGGVLRYTLDLLSHHVEGPSDPARESDLDAKIKDAEKRATAALNRVLDKASGKGEFDRRTLGTTRK
jgi:hypothetical protein